VDSLYAIASLFAGPGIGNTASRAALGLWRAGLLHKLVALGHNPTDIAEDRIVDVWFPPRGALRFLSDKPFYWLKNRRFDRVCRRHADGDFDVVHLWNNQASRTAAEVKARGQKLIIERANFHIRPQSRLLTEAYERFGIHYQPTYQETIDRCAHEYELADLVLTPSRASRASFVGENADLGKVIRCPFGADLARFARREKPPAQFRAIFVGQLGVRKGILTLLEAWKRAALDGELWLVGGPEEAIGAQLAPWRTRPDVKFMGFRRDVPELMRASSVFVFPSLEEGSALVSYEAMACGLPLILTDETGSVARDGVEALIIKPNDVDGLAAALAALAADPDRAERMGVAARRRVEQFPWTDYGDRIALIHRLLAEGRSGPEIQHALEAQWPAMAEKNMG
jgi:glycosyltransferase involved in cell wall biosynthesis